MIYLVSTQLELFNETALYQRLTAEEALTLIQSFDVVQFDTETTGRDPRICKVLCAQFGNKKQGHQIVVDTQTINLKLFKDVLETKLLIGQNLKFDCQFLYNYDIIPTKIWDTMVIEQLLHLGYDPKFFHYSLKAISERRLGIDIDKSIRGQIIWRGLDSSVIQYAANDVVHLEDIMEQQSKECIENKCTIGADLENNFVPVIAYLEWCGIKLDVDKWQKKMDDNQAKLDIAQINLNKWLLEYTVTNPKFNKYVDLDLFEGRRPSISWSSPKQVVTIAQELGFNTNTEDKKTGKSKDSVVEKILSVQKGINDEFLKLYFNFQEASKQCSTYGQNYIDAINPLTGRIHTTFKQLGAASGRMSCGNSMANNTDLAKIKKIVPSRCKYVQLQNLPSDAVTRNAFVAAPNNLMCSCDYAALESRLGADIYNEKAMLNEFLTGSGDIHSLVAKACFAKELENIEVKDIERLRPDLRQRAKPVEFSQQFGGSANAIKNSLNCTYKAAKEIADGYNNGFPGIAAFKILGAKFVRKNGYITICERTGHKMYWADHAKWLSIEKLPTHLQERECSEDEMKEHNMGAAKWDRLSLNAPTQGTGIIILKYAMILFFKYIVRENLFKKVLICNLIHDEAVIEYPENRPEVAEKLQFYMEKSAGEFCKKLPIPAKPSIGKYWIH